MSIFTKNKLGRLAVAGLLLTSFCIISCDHPAGGSPSDADDTKKTEKNKTEETKKKLEYPYSSTEVNGIRQKIQDAFLFFKLTTDVKAFLPSPAAPAEDLPKDCVYTISTDYNQVLWLDKDSNTIYYYNPEKDKNIMTLGDNCLFLFSDCKELEEVDLSGFDTRDVFKFERMFLNCKKLKKVTFGDYFFTDKLNSMENMFKGCESLESIVLKSNKNTGRDGDKLYTLTNMFSGCTALKEVTLDFGTQAVEKMDYVFYDCKSLEKVTFGDTFGIYRGSDKVYYNSMFFNCESLETIDLSKFSWDREFYAVKMFGNCAKLKTIYTKADTDLHNVSTDSKADIIGGCTSLVGGNGTKYDENNYKSAYLRVDTADNPGYFTAKE